MTIDKRGFAAAVIIAVYFLAFAGPGLRLGFTYDDLMNLYRAWTDDWSGHAWETVLFFLPSDRYRPAGSAFYRALFLNFDFWALPYRAACFALLLMNLWLAYRLAARLGHSRLTGALTAAALAYHGSMATLYVSTGFCYDILCFTFYMGAFLYYVEARRSGEPLTAGQQLIWCGLYALCLGSKEMGVTLPVMMLAWEWLEHGCGRWNWFWREGRTVGWGTLMTAAFVVGRVMNARGLAAIDGYRMDVRPEVYLDRAWHLLWFATYSRAWLTPGRLGALALGLAVVGMMARRRVAKLALIWVPVGILPIAFIPQRGLEAAYIACFGAALLAASLVEDWTRVTALWIGRERRAVAVFAAWMALLGWWHMRRGVIAFEAWAGEPRHIRSMYLEFKADAPRLAEAKNVLFVRDPFPPPHIWASLFLIQLTTKRTDIVVYRPERMDGNALERFDVVYDFDGQALARCDAAPFAGAGRRDLREIECVPPGQWRPPEGYWSE